jgi:hypothetical protein
MSLGVGSCVVLYLASPREQAFGLVLAMNTSGVVVRGMTLASVEDWLRGLGPDEDSALAATSLATTFYPMHRIEKISLDEPSYGTPPIHERFERRTGLSFVAVALREHSDMGGDDE